MLFIEDYLYNLDWDIWNIGKGADQGQMPQNATTSDQVMQCLLKLQDVKG